MRGGMRYGAGRPGWRQKCEYKLPIDVRVLHRKGRLVAGQSFGWQWSRDGERFANISADTHLDALVLSYTWTPYGHEPRAVHCRVPLTRTPCRYGGERTWFLCPDCGRVCAVLFGISRRGNFACRVCQRLVYASEAESPIDRCWRQQRKIEAKLGEILQRPKGMKQITFQRLTNRWVDIEERKDDLWWPMAARLLG